MIEEILKSIDVLKIQKNKLKEEEIKMEQSTTILKEIEYVDQLLKKYYLDLDQIKKLNNQNNLDKSKEIIKEINNKKIKEKQKTKKKQKIKKKKKINIIDR